MNVAIWTAHFLPHVGGVENFSALLWPRVAQMGHNVKLITCNTSRADLLENFEGVTVVRLPCLNLLSGRYPIPVAWAPYALTKFDVAVTNTRFFVTSFLGAATAKRRRRPFIHIEHGSGWQVTGNFLVNGIVRLVDTTVGRWVLTNADVVCAVSTDSARYCSQLVRREVVILPNAIDTKVFQVGDRSLREKLGIPTDAVVILFAGRLVEEKGIREYVHVAEQLAQKDTHFIVAGIGRLACYVEHLARRNPAIHYLGRVAHDEMYRLYAAADIVCHPSYCLEGLPTVVLEAGAAGCAVIAARTTGIGDIIPTEEYGVIVEPRNVAQLRAAVTGLIQNASRRKELGRRLQSRIRERFDIALVAMQVEGLLRRVVDANRKTKWGRP